MEDLNERIKKVESAVIMAGLATKEVLTFDEAATFTGLSKSYLYKLTAGKEVPHYKPTGKMCYFNRMELQAWLQKNRIITVEELEEQAAAYALKAKKGGKK
jgi:excisionase family DNA binding protein